MKIWYDPQAPVSDMCVLLRILNYFGGTQGGRNPHYLDNRDELCPHPRSIGNCTNHAIDDSKLSVLIMFSSREVATESSRNAPHCCLCWLYIFCAAHHLSWTTVPAAMIRKLLFPQRDNHSELLHTEVTIEQPHFLDDRPLILCWWRYQAKKMVTPEQIQIWFAVWIGGVCLYCMIPTDSKMAASRAYSRYFLHNRDGASANGKWWITIAGRLGKNPVALIRSNIMMQIQHIRSDRLFWQFHLHLHWAFTAAVDKKLTTPYSNQGIAHHPGHHKPPSEQRHAERRHRIGRGWDILENNNSSCWWDI